LASISIDLGAGWTFISLNLELDDMRLNSVFKQLTLAGGDQIKSQTLFSEYYEGFGFFGGLFALTTDDMYAMKLSTSATLTLIGSPTTLPKMIVLNRGWTFLPCPYQISVPLASGAPTFTYASGDQFKSQYLFAEFYTGFGWFGGLMSLEPGLGYKLRAAGGPATFQSQQ
jgi:hypothetical protein